MNQDKDRQALNKFLGNLVPKPIPMESLVQPLRVWVVCILEPGHKDNYMTGRMVWPEVLVCESREKAQDLCNYLNEASFFDYLKDVRQDEPDADQETCHQLWLKNEYAHYLVEEVPNLQSYKYINKVGENNGALERVFITLSEARRVRRMDAQ